MTEDNYDKPERIQKYLSRYGVASRRKVEELIKDGEITVNGEVASLGCKVDAKSKIIISGKRFIQPSTRNPEQTKIKLLMYHKPIGKVCTSNDPDGRDTVYDDLPKIYRAKWISIGRLDLNTSGLLLFTNDGELANKLMHPSNGFEREYLVRVLGTVDTQKIKILLKGVDIEGKLAKFEKITELKKDQPASANRWFKVVLAEGRNREVRKLWEAVDCKVSRLSRIRFGPYKLPRDLKVGDCREVSIHQDVTDR